jgi:release factor glutamine methyltransferase
MQLREALRAGIATLDQRQIPSASLAAELLLMHVLGSDRGYLHSYPELDLPAETVERYFRLIAERATGKPTQYITGHQEFWGLDFEVGPAVLIPRPETELLVESVLELVKGPGGGRADRRDAGREAVRIVDVGTGSGCIALALASELPSAAIFATDISRPALDVARRNARRLGLADRVRFAAMDLLGAFAVGGERGFDFVVSNPPYVGCDEARSVQREVREFEPRIAWGGDNRSGEIYRRLFPQAFDLLGAGGYVLVEVGYNQADTVAGLLGDGWMNPAIRPDLAGIPRVVLACKDAGVRSQ